MTTKMADPKHWLRSGFALFFEYNTPRIVHIRSKKVGIINRFLQLVIISYIAVYAIYYKKGYQEFDDVQSAVTTKVKGIVFSNYSHIPEIGMRTWDVADYVIPPQENSAFFVMTNVIPTLGQTQSMCSEDPTIENIKCENDDYCERLKGTILPGGNGPLTGKCVNSTGALKVCEIYGWCPVENGSPYKNLTQPILAGSQNFTVFIKNNIEFPKFDVRRRNLPEHATNESAAFLSSCLYNASDPNNKLCPIFRLDAIVTGAGYSYSDLTSEVLRKRDQLLLLILYTHPSVTMRNILDLYENDTDFGNCRWNRNDSKGKFCPIFVLNDIAKDAGVNYDDLTLQGGVMQIIIDWTCNLDQSVDNCLPEYSFRRLDRGDYVISRGFNFRYADKFAVKENNTFVQYRNLYKATGIVFVVTVQGKAGKFSFFPLVINIGSGLAMLALATIACDIIVLYLLKARNFYRDKKYLDVQGQDAFRILEEESPQDRMEGSSSSIKKRNVTHSYDGNLDGDGTDT